MLKIVHPVCCGIDVHKKFLVATIASTNLDNVTTYEKRNFTTHYHDLEALKKWLTYRNCSEVCMESTGKYWIPVYNALESVCKITLANPKYVRAIPGKKTDEKDSVWISDLHKHGLVPGSYIPDVKIRKLRELTRYQTKLVGNRTGEKNRINNSLTVSNVTLDNVISDVFGKTGTDIRNYILNCEKFDVEECKKLIDPRIKASPDVVIQSVIGYQKSIEQSTKSNLAMKHLESIDSCLSLLTQTINTLALPFEKQIKLLETVPGIKRPAAIAIISEISADMSAFSTAKKLCSWAGLTPQNNESAGKKRSSKISRAGAYLKPLLVQCANAAVKSKKEPYFKNKYSRLKKRMGHKKAIIAIARMMLTCIYFMIKNNAAFAPLDLNITEKTVPSVKANAKKLNSAISLIQKMGYIVLNSDNSPVPVGQKLRISSADGTSA